jgi:Tol biopolymer transport system component
MRSDGGSQTLATVDDGRAEDRNPSFTPDGRFIVFISNREGDRFQSYLVSPDGRTLVRITDNNRNDISLTYRPELLFRIR